MIRLIFIFSIFTLNGSHASPILLHMHDAVVWHPGQTITGELSEPAPVVKPMATVTDNEVLLHAILIENPYKRPLKYLWIPDSRNPALCQITHKEDTIASLEMPARHGTYYFNLLVMAENDSVWFQTFVRRDERGIHPFDMDSEYPSWMDNAIIYQITPFAFVKNGTFEDITAKLHEIKNLGINTILLQPVYETFFGHQGYDVTGYLSLNPELGTEKQLRHLIATAKALEIRVLFDVVLNHSSIHHPYAQDRIKYGDKSHYYDYYQDENDGKPYSSFYKMDEHGFVTYFWKDLINLNYNNEKVQRWMLEVCKYWIREFDIDGYRFDAIWGVNARMPSFAKRLRTELKSIKPEVLLLAEDKGSVPEVYALGYDAAYDWASDTTWISQWSWEYEYDARKSHTIFNTPHTDQRGKMLGRALFHPGGNEHQKLRYMENNDLPRFILEHGLARTKMVAALLFSLPGIPMLYNGQEIGFQEHPYSTDAIFQRESSIQSLDENGLFNYYQKLIRLHKKYPALSGTAIHELTVSPEGSLVAFHRWKDDENFIIIVNMGSTLADANIDIREIVTKDSESEKYQLQDLLTDMILKKEKDASQVKIPMEGYSVRWFLLKKLNI